MSQLVTQTIKGDIMNYKINTICFIFLFIFLVSAVSAANCDNETATPLASDAGQDIISADSSADILQASNSTTATKQKVTLKAPNVKMYYKDGHKFSVTVKDKNKKAINKAKVKITINGKTYNKTTDKKGTTSIALKLKPGNYSVLTVFSKTSKYKASKLTSNVLIKSTIKNDDFTKYYKNTAKYSSKFYDQKGKLLKNTEVKFKLNNKTHKVKTTSKGTAKLSIDLKPGTYKITTVNSKTTESIKKTIIIKSLIESEDLTMNYGDGSKFNVKILNSKGKASPNKKVTFKVNGKTYNKTTDKNGTANLDISLKAGKYTITTVYGDLKSTNKIVINAVKKTNFTHIIQIPSYVNVTNSYVYPNTAYTVKSGIDGIIRMPKQMIITVQTESQSYLFSTNYISGMDTVIIGYKYHFIPFDGSGIKSEIDKNKLKGNGIIISSTTNYTQIEYQSQTDDNVDLFGFYADKGFQNSETITYVQNNKIKAKVNFQTLGFDELGLKMNLAKIYGTLVYDFNYKTYSEVTYGNTESIKFTKTNEPVTFSYFGNSIVGYLTKEDIKTKLTINDKEELDKIETISYGLSEKYRNSMGFEVLQSYAIVNDKVNENTVDKWLSKKSNYLNRNEVGIKNIYGMFLTCLETSWRADELANSLSKEMNVKWSRLKTTTILSGINLETTYIHILNADMGMEVKSSDKTNISLFKLINSLGLPEIEEASLNPVNKTFEYSSSNSLRNLLNSTSYEIAFNDQLTYIHGDNSAIILNESTGVVNVLMEDEGFQYKGSTIKTTDDCCICSLLPHIISAALANPIVKSAIMDPLTKYAYPTLIVSYNLIKNGIAYKLIELGEVGSASFGILTLCLNMQILGTTVKNNVEKEHWHTLMDTVTFTRPGFFQGKKVYNIPNKNGGYDYIEVPVKSDLSLDRDNAQYISNGKVKKLTKKETYQYFKEESWTPINLPTKYWDKSWDKLIKSS